MVTLTVTSQTIGIISFVFTLLTALGVYISLLKAFRSAPPQIPTTLGNLRQELLAEKSLLRSRLKEGDRFHVFPGRETRRNGKFESHIRLYETTLKQTWKDFCALERQFLMSNDTDEEDRDDHSDQSATEDEKDLKHRSRASRRPRRKDSHITRMGMQNAGLSIDHATYYRTGMGRRLLWWWKRDDVQYLESHVSRLQTRRTERDVYEIDELIKRTLCIIAEMRDQDVRITRGPDGSSADNTRRRRRAPRDKKRTSRSPRQIGTREVYEKEIRRVRPRSTPHPSSSRSFSLPPRSEVMLRRRGSLSRATSRRREPSVEYEVVNPGRVWVDVVDNYDIDGAPYHGTRSS